MSHSNNNDSDNVQHNVDHNYCAVESSARNMGKGRNNDTPRPFEKSVNPTDHRSDNNQSRKKENVKGIMPRGLFDQGILR